MAALLLACGAQGFIYQPGAGQIWDPSLIAWRGSYYAIAMYSEAGDGAYKAGWLASSPDGAHWNDVGPIASSLPGIQWWKGFVLQLRGEPEPLFVLNHGIYEPGSGNDALRVLTSPDLRNWTVSATSRSNPTWYHPSRWDHMYMSEHPDGGYIGYPVSSPLSGFPGAWPGVQRSTDGVQWKAQAPLPVNWGGVHLTSIEEGGFERLELPDSSGRAHYFLIGGGCNFGSCYSMWAFRADSIDGPYAPCTRRFRLSGGAGGTTPGQYGWLAAWSRGPNGERTISNYMSPEARIARADVWMLPMRAPLVDAEGNLRLGYWKGNDALLKPDATALPPTTLACVGNLTAGWLAALDGAAHRQGSYLSAKLSASGTGAVGIAVEDVGITRNGSYTALLLDVGDADDLGTASRIVRYDAPASPGWRGRRVVGVAQPDAAVGVLEVKGTFREVDRTGAFECGTNTANVTCGVGLLTAFEPGAPRELLLLLRRGMFEVYLDDLLVQTFVYGGGYPLPAGGSGRIGLSCDGGGQLALSEGRVGRLDLPAE